MSTTSTTNRPAPSVWHRRQWVSPLIIPTSAGDACDEADKRQADASRLKKEHAAAVEAFTSAERAHSAAVRSSVEAGTPSPSREPLDAAAAHAADLAERSIQAVDIKAGAAKRAHRALMEGAPEMIEAMPEMVAAGLEDIAAEGLNEERATMVETALSALGFYRTLSKAPGTLSWRPVTVDLVACRGVDAVGVFTAAAQATLARILNTPA